MEQFPIIGWVRLLVTIIVFLASCTGLGYLVGAWSRRRVWTREIYVPICIIIAFLWPAIFIADSWYTSVTCLPRNPDQACDAPIYALIGATFFVAPILFIISLVLILNSALRARRKESS
jgi:hypothetical protein